MKIISKRSFIKILFTVFLISIVMVISAYANSQPWDPYSKYIPNQTPTQKRQLRGTWISTVVNLDWPSAKTSNIKNDAERILKSKDELISLLDKAVEMKMNAVFLQVSPTGDALYKSNVVPWSRYLTGTFGKDPGFDPLAFAVNEAHKRNLEIHAWFNPYRVSMDTKDITKSSLNIEKSVYKEHPQWIKTSTDRFVVDPGIPDARKWVINRVMEVVNNYDVDGVHFDDYFYYESYKGELKDQDTFKKYNNGQFSNIDDWRRNNTYLLVKELSNKLRKTKSWVKFGISPAGVWGNKKDGLDGSNTNTSFTNFNRCFADTKKWVEEELIDYIAPQIYFSFANKNAPYGELATWWSNVCNGKKVHLYIGQALYKVNADSDQYFKGENAVQEFIRQLRFNITKPEIMGSIMFRTQNLNDESKQQVVNTIKNDLWSTRALAPVMPWKGGKTPVTPTLGKLNLLSNGANLSWSDKDPHTTYFAIYRFNSNEKIDINSDASASNLIGTVRKNNNDVQQFIDMQTKTLNNITYIVTSLDRLHNESSGLKITPSLSTHFSDISQNYSWASTAIDTLYTKGIIKGDNYGMFNPGHNTKRGDFILMIIRALNLNTSFKDNFKDIDKTSYYYNVIGIAKALEIAKGSKNYFYPNNNITREDMMVIVVRALNAKGIKLQKEKDDYLSSYNDSKLISNYAREAVSILTKAGIVQGSGNKINPKYMATRAEIVVILDRVLNNLVSR